MKNAQNAMKMALNQVSEALQNICTQDTPALGIDLDGTIDEAPFFFKTLAAVWPGEVIILTYRDDRTKTEADLARLGIKWDQIVLVDSFEAKARIIEEKGILAYFDDQPEILKHVPSSVNVFLIRNEGNFDFEDRKWMFSNSTVKLA
jgi:hypothetical protein